MKTFYIDLFSVILISCVGGIAYSNAFHCSFHFDDIKSIINNPFIKDIYNTQNIWDYLPRRFILYLSFALNYHFNKLDVSGYHWFNLSVHLVSAISVWWLTRLTLSTPEMAEDKITRYKNPIALFAGLVFVSHPVQTQAVTYIVQRAASMASMLYVVALCFYVKSRLAQDKRPVSGLGKFYYFCALITAIAAMFTKETAITLPLMILIYDLSFFKDRKRYDRGRWLLFLLTLCIIPLTMLWTESASFVQKVSSAEISSMHYLLTQFRVMVTYIRLAFLPLKLNLDYDYPISKNIFEPPTLISFLFLIGILYWAKLLFSKYRLVSVSIFWFFLTLLPESSFFPIKDVIFEHRLYLSMVGYSIFLTCSVFYLMGLIGKNSAKPMVVILTMIVVCNTVLTYQRNRVWKDELTLWEDVIQKSPHKARPYNNLGLEYSKKGDFFQALLDLNKAIELDPKFAYAYNNRGLLYAKQGNYTRARSDLSKAIEMNPRFAVAYNSLGNVYSQRGDWSQAILSYNKAIEIDPIYTDAYYNRGILFEKKGGFAQALADYSMAINIDPDDAEAYYNRGNVHKDQNNFTQALSDYNKAIEEDPHYAKAYINHGLIFANQGNFTQAISDFNRALAIDPENAEGYINRGTCYAQQGDFIQALSDFNNAIARDPDNAGLYFNRAATYYQLKEYDRAWGDVHKMESRGTIMNPNFLDDLIRASGRRW